MEVNGSISTASTRKGLAIVSNALTPYRVHLHRRIAKEIPEFRLHSIFTHGGTDFTWKMDVPESIGAVSFASRDASTGKSPWLRLFAHYRKGSRILNYLRRHDVKAVILHGYNDATRLRLAMACPKYGIRVFLRGDSNIKGDTKVRGLKRWCKRRLVAYFIRRSDVIMPMGRLGQAYFEDYGASKEDCIFVPLEPDYERFASISEEAVALFRERFQLVRDKHYILFCGRLIHLKRVDVLLDAFARLSEKRSNWELLIVGDGPLRDELKKRPSAVKVGKRCHWLGFLDGEELVHAFHAADVLALPSEYEAWALVVNEAMAAGLVVVASDVVGAAYELIQDGRNGRVFPRGDVGALTEALSDVTDESALQVYRAEVQPILADWRQRADPVDGVRRALRRVGLLES